LTSLGIVAALRQEARTLANRQLPVSVTIKLRDNILLKVSGLGAKRARTAAQSLLTGGATALLSWGSAGGLAANLTSGTLIVPKTIIASDQSVYPVDAVWHERLCLCLRGYQDFHTGTLAESPTVLNSPTEKRVFCEQYDALAVDMESASVAQVARDAQVPFIAVRAVADPMEMTIPRSALDATDEHGRTQPLKVLYGLVRNPSELSPLIRLHRHFRNALRTLAAVERLAGASLFGLLL
jgi:adenosylhomocysteine nucleosidase